MDDWGIDVVIGASQKGFECQEGLAIVTVNKELIEYKATRQSIGGSTEKEADCFLNNDINIKTGDRIYLFSDGYADQFGGPNNKKFMKKRLANLLSEICEMPMKEQSERLDSELNKWIGNNEQIDDILILGITL